MNLRTVYKYPVPVDDEVWIKMPKGASILTVQEQRGEPCIWALVDPEAPMTEHRFRLAGTGHDIEWQENMVYRGTFQMRNGALVFHLFEYVLYAK